MAITLKDLKPKKLGEVVRELNYKDLVSFTMRISDDKDYVSAIKQIQKPEKPLTKDSLSKANNAVETLSQGEAMMIIIGEYVITEWDVKTSDGKVAPINGDNFMALCASVGDDDENAEFVGFISDNFHEMAKEFALQASETKKKPSASGRGTKKAAS